MRRTILFGLLATLLVAVGCVRLPRENLEVQRYTIDPSIPEAKADTSLDLTLYVAPFRAGADQKGERILYRDDEYRMNYYYYHRWLVSPEQMIGDDFAQNMLAWGLFKGGVFQTAVGILPTHEIHGRLLALYADNIRKQYGARFEANLTVFRVNQVTYEKTVIWQKNYPIAVARDNAYVSSYIDAANQAVGEWFKEVRKDLEPLLIEDAKEIAAERKAAVEGQVKPPQIPFGALAGDLTRPKSQGTDPGVKGNMTGTEKSSPDGVDAAGSEGTAKERGSGTSGATSKAASGTVAEGAAALGTESAKATPSGPSTADTTANDSTKTAPTPAK